ncbi:MAG TPA: diguanylate cyclase [Ilumatobacteraceae bacterium]|nr:diguanylate cyclase [Ilumatobacteraceae bacterium]
MTRSSPRAVHIVDATKGPLVGDGRFQRMMPFALTATISLVIAIPSTSWARPAFAVAGSALAIVTIIMALVVPWIRTPRAAQLIPAFAFLVATLLLICASRHGIGSPFVTLTVLPLMWLALYENRSAVLVAALLAGLTLRFGVPSGTADSSALGFASTAVFVVCCAGMGITLHGLVADARQLAFALRDRQVALEDTASMLDALPERVSRYRVADHAISYCNAAWAAQYKVDAAEAIGRLLDEFLSEDELEGLHAQLALLGPDSPILVDKVARAVPDAPGQWLQWVDSYLVGPDGPEILSIGRDVTERQEAERKLAESEALFRDLADKSADVVWRVMTEPTPHFNYMSPSVENVLGYPPSYFVEDFNRMLDLLDDDGRRAVDRALHSDRALGRFDARFRHANSSIVVVETQTSLIEGGLQGVSRDVTELRQLQARTAALALRDPLTGLANRRLLEELLDADLARTQRGALPLAVAFLDLDAFKSVNDTHGHIAGDLVLCETAHRLLTIVRGADTVARLGGDEFVIVYEPNEASSRNLVQRIDQALSAPIHITPTTVVTCPASIGVADTRATGYNRDALLTAADEAMYNAKRAKRNAEARGIEPLTSTSPR